MRKRLLSTVSAAAVLMLFLAACERIDEQQEARLDDPAVYPEPSPEQTVSFEEAKEDVPPPPP